MKFLVIGNALEESVSRTEDSRTRRHIGGVGAIMARELALAGAEVTFLTTAPEGEATDRINTGMNVHGVNTVITPGSPRQTRASSATIYTRNGCPVRAKGYWAYMGGLTGDMNRIMSQHHWTLISLNLQEQDLRACADAPNLIINATSKKLAARMHIPGRAKACTMNEQELRELKAQHRDRSLHEATGAQTIMATLGQKGWKMKHQGGEELRHPTVSVPEGTDFIGAGDAATAGLAWALANELDVPETVNQFISDLLHRNAKAYTLTCVPT